MSNASDFLIKHFDAKLIAQTPLSLGGYIQCWRIGDKLLPVQNHADGQVTIFLPTLVANEYDLKTAIEDYLKGGFRKVIPVGAFK